MKVRSGWTLAQWAAHCELDAPDEEVAGSAWIAARITPPPVLSPPRTRYPLERAAELLRRAEEATGERSERLCGEALEWLGHPHPRASPGVLGAMDRLRGEVEALRGERSSRTS